MNNQLFSYDLNHSLRQFENMKTYPSFLQEIFNQNLYKALTLTHFMKIKQHILKTKYLNEEINN